MSGVLRAGAGCRGCRDERHRHDRAQGGLQARSEAKLAEVERKIADLQAIRASLIAARDAGCDDLVRCAESDCCPMLFGQIAARRYREIP